MKVNDEFISLFTKGEAFDIKPPKKDIALIFSVIYAFCAVGLLIVSHLFLELQPYSLFLQFGYFGNIDKIITLLSFSLIPISLIFLLASTKSEKNFLRIFSCIFTGGILIVKLSAFIMYQQQNSLLEVGDEVSKKITLIIYAFFVFLYLVGIITYCFKKYKISAVFIKIFAIAFLIANSIFFIGFTVFSIENFEKSMLFFSLVFLLEAINSFFALVLAKRIKHKQ